MAIIYTPDKRYKAVKKLIAKFEARGGKEITSPKAISKLNTGMALEALRDAAYNDKQNFPNGGEPRFDKDMLYNSTVFGCIEKEIAQFTDENGNPKNPAHAKEIQNAKNLSKCVRFVMDVTDLSNEQVLELFTGEPKGNDGNFLCPHSVEMSTKLAMVWTNEGEPDLFDLTCALAEITPHATNKPVVTDEYKRALEIFNPPEGTALTYENLTHDLHNEMENWSLGYNYRNKGYEKAPFSEKYATRYEWEKAKAQGKEQAVSNVMPTPLLKPERDTQTQKDTEMGM